jgi:hypothetical protein
MSDVAEGPETSVSARRVAPVRCRTAIASGTARTI